MEIFHDYTILWTNIVKALEAIRNIAKPREHCVSKCKVWFVDPCHYLNARLSLGWMLLLLNSTMTRTRHMTSTSRRR